jgi:tetratricopeptide (TPR) repeat protein
MKKKHIYLFTIVLFVLAAGFIVVKYKKDGKAKAASVYLLKDRMGLLSATEEWKKVQDQYTSLIKIVRTNPDDTKSRLSLAALYIQEARVTGDHMYYDMAAMQYVNEVLEKEPQHFEALIYKSLLFLSQHHFVDGLLLAEKAREANPDNAFVYGILIDGNVEMGNYKEAVADAEKMISIRPDMRSYSRISYLREIHGDYPGAIEAMKLAVDAAPPGDEATEWARVQLGHMYEYTGDLANAAMCYSLALQYRPSYAYALAGEARLAMTAKDYNKATALYLKADSLTIDYSFKEELVDVYQLSGHKKKADSLTQWLIVHMNKDAQKGADDENIGHYADRELAYTYLKSGDYDKAVGHALAEYNRRPANIDVNETVAWAYYKKGETAKAIPYATTALKTKSKNPVLLCRLGLIYAKAGDKTKAKELLQEAFQHDPSMPVSLKAEGMNCLETL